MMGVGKCGEAGDHCGDFGPSAVRFGSMLSKNSVFSIELPLMRHIRLELGRSLPLKLPHFAGGYANDAECKAAGGPRARSAWAGRAKSSKAVAHLCMVGMVGGP